MQMKEIRALNTKETEHKLDEAYKELFNLRFQWEAGQLVDHNRITAVRRDIARYKTVLREREIAALAEELPAAKELPQGEAK
jgi:large subunit ribosomal protein L29